MITEVPATAPLLIESLKTRYPARRIPALDGIDLAVAAGERVGVAGRTGAGKSTLALAAAGFIPRVVRAKVDGRVVIEGIDAATSSPGELLGRVGIVFTTPSNQLSASKLTVREELAFGLENLGMPRAEMDGRPLASWKACVCTCRRNAWQIYARRHPGSNTNCRPVAGPRCWPDLDCVRR